MKLIPVGPLSVRSNGGWKKLSEPVRRAIGVDLAGVADLLSAIADGGIILSRVMHDKTILPGQVMADRELVTALFIGVAGKTAICHPDKTRIDWNCIICQQC